MDGERGVGRRSGREELGEEKGIYSCGSRAGTLQITGQQTRLVFVPEPSVSQDLMAAYRDVSLCEGALGWEPGRKQIPTETGAGEVLKIPGTDHMKGVNRRWAMSKTPTRRYKESFVVMV